MSLLRPLEKLKNKKTIGFRRAKMLLPVNLTTRNIAIKTVLCGDENESCEEIKRTAVNCKWRKKKLKEGN